MSEMAEIQSTITSAEPTRQAQGSSAPQPLKVPPPTFWPFITAIGMAIVFWGVVLNLLVVCVGIGVFVIGMVGLAGDWIREHNESA